VAEQLRAADLALVTAVQRERVRIQLAASPGTDGIDAALAQYPLAEIPAANRPYLLLAAVYAEGGRPDLAEAWLAERASALPPTMKRAEDASYQEAVAHVHLACGEPAAALAALGEYLSNSSVSIGEVAFLLGFSDQSTFNRAFRRWTGEAPGRWRTRGTLRTHA
jgi:AraC-like DNA-binding protein